MISTYSEYIHRYLTPDGLQGKRVPGEHHFVAVYLLPRLQKTARGVPDFVNPDGMKGIIGDVVYEEHQKRGLSIEVKLQTVHLTKNEYNKWVVRTKEADWPDIFLGVGSRGVILLKWSEFRRAYIAAVQARDAHWTPQEIEDGYGPMKGVDVLISAAADAPGCFLASTEPEEAQAEERRFCEKLISMTLP